MSRASNSLIIKPVGGVEIDWTKPLARGLDLYLWLDDKPLDFVRRDLCATTVTGAARPSTTAAGRQLYAPDNGWYDIDVQQSWTGNYTIAFGAQVLALPTWGGVFSKRSSGTANQAGFSRNDTADEYTLFHDDVTGAVFSLSYISSDIGVPLVFVLTWDGSTSTLGRTGRAPVSVSYSTAPASGTASLLLGAERGASTSYDGDVGFSWFARWTRALSRAEIASLTTSPFALLRPIHRRIWIEVSGGTTVSPSSIASAASVVNPSVVLGSLSVAPAVLSGAASVVSPSVVLGSIAVVPAVSAAAAGTVDPSVTLGSLSLTPAALAALAGVVDPSVSTGGLMVSPSALDAGAVTVNPVVILGSIVLAPASLDAQAGVISPGVILGAISLTPGMISVAASVIDPGILTGGISISPASIDLAGGMAGPSVSLGSILLTPSAIAAILSTVNPVVLPAAVVDTPTSRIIVVGEEVRAWAIAAENRVYVIAAQNRVMTIQ